MYRRRFLQHVFAAPLSAALFPAQAAGLGEELPVVARPGLWPVASRPIWYRGRLWFANSVKGVDHNSAELYSFAPDAGRLRHERHLWSQDAGRPCVARGLMYWPAEDHRLLGGWGGFQVSNGSAWGIGLIPKGRIFHVHAMSSIGSTLFAATSAWQTALYVSQDYGSNWRRIFIYPATKARVHRLVSLRAMARRMFAVLHGPQGDRLVVADVASAEFARQWPSGATQPGLAQLGGQILALVTNNGRTQLWQSDGDNSEYLYTFPVTWQPFSLTSGRGKIWLLTGNGVTGKVWSSASGQQWQEAAQFFGGNAYDLLVTHEAIVVTGAGADGRGIVWAKGAAPLTSKPLAELPDLLPQLDGTGINWDKEASTLDALLLNEAAYAKIGRILRDKIYRLARRGPPADFFQALLRQPRLHGRVNPFLDVIIPDRGAIAAFWLLFGIGIAKVGKVPSEILDSPWRLAKNSPAKYFDPLLTALWASGQRQQSDDQTLGSLLHRVANTAEPKWLRMDAAGALEVISGRHYGDNFKVWQEWGKTQGL